MSPHPIDQDVRRRLLEAQRAEADALKAVELAGRARDRAQKRLAEAQAELDDAKMVLVQCSGISRAALLLDEDVATIRRTTRTVAATRRAATRPSEASSPS